MKTCSFIPIPAMTKNNLYKQMPVLLENEILTSWLHMGVSLNGGIPKTPQNDHFQ